MLPNQRRQKLDIIYEDADILLLNKPVGMLSQKAQPQDVSAVEYLISYLLEGGQLTGEELQRFHPSVCNRLDRNTSGILIAGKSLPGLQQMSELLRDRSLHKYYCCIVNGTMRGTKHLKGYLVKDHASNRVTILNQLPEKAEKSQDAQPIETVYRAVASQERTDLTGGTACDGTQPSDPCSSGLNRASDSRRSRNMVPLPIIKRSRGCAVSYCMPGGWSFRTGRQRTADRPFSHSRQSCLTSFFRACLRQNSSGF